MSDSESAARACQEKARLLRRCAVTKSEYNRTTEVIPWRVGDRYIISNFKGLAEFAQNARKAMEEARQALERHTAEHGC